MRVLLCCIEAEMTRVALDGFGSDGRPGPELLAAQRAKAAGVGVELVGDRATLERAAHEQGLDPSGLEIIQASEQIAMDESPARAVRSKPDASLCVAMKRVAQGLARGVVSAGNTGAILAAALVHLGRLQGVERPAIATRFPRADAYGEHTVMLDAGANVECKVQHLLQFAVMGAAFARVSASVPRPRVGLLSNGSERSKGTVLTRKTHEILARHAEFAPAGALEFVGYVEPAQLFSSVCDVVVTDGWTGNIALKLAEGAMSAWPRLLVAADAAESNAAEGVQKNERSAVSIAPALKSLARVVDPEFQGGAPLLGVDGVVMICHGACGPGALKVALSTVQRFAQAGSTQAIGEAIADHHELFEFERTTR